MDELVTLADGLMVFETGAVCEKLTQAGIRFELSQVSATDAGIVSPRKNNWASALTHVCNYFNRGGLGVYMRIRVAANDFERAKAILAPTEQKRTDGKRLLIWIVGGVVLVLLLYAFAHPHVRSTAFVDDAESEVRE